MTEKKTETMWLFTVEIDIGRDISFDKYRVETESDTGNRWERRIINDWPPDLCMEHTGLLPGSPMETVRGAAVLLPENNDTKAMRLLCEWLDNESRYLHTLAEDYGRMADVTASGRHRFVNRSPETKH